MGKTKTTTKSNETATTTPNLSPAMQTGIDGYYGQVNNMFGSGNAGDMFLTQANDNQQGAFDAAGNLGGWQTGLNQSNTLAGFVMNSWDTELWNVQDWSRVK